MSLFSGTASPSSAATTRSTSSSPTRAATTEHKLPAPLPAFKTPEQLAKWRSEKAEKASAQDAKVRQESNAVFYTGKPFLAETGAYAFKYRNYDPELSRWTSADPSGFPDGVNSSIYVAVPTFQLDYQGLATLAVTDDGNGSPANHGSTTFTWAWSISHNGTVVFNGGEAQSATAQYVNDHIGNFGGVTVRSASVGTAYTFSFYAPGAVTHHDTAQTFYTDATHSGQTFNYGTWVNTGWSLTALAFDSFGNNDYTGLNNQPNGVVNNGVKLLSNTNIGGGIDSYLVGQLATAGFTTASSDADKFYVAGGGAYNE